MSATRWSICFKLGWKTKTWIIILSWMQILLIKRIFIQTHAWTNCTGSCSTYFWLFHELHFFFLKTMSFTFVYPKNSTQTIMFLYIGLKGWTTHHVFLVMKRLLSTTGQCYSLLISLCNNSSTLHMVASCYMRWILRWIGGLKNRVMRIMN